MQQCPWEANKYSASQEIPRIVWNPNVLYRIQKCPPPLPILSQLDPIYSPTSHFLKIYLNIILSFMPGFPKWSLSFRFFHQNPVYASHHSRTRYMPRQFHSFRFYHPNTIGCGVPFTENIWIEINLFYFRLKWLCFFLVLCFSTLCTLEFSILNITLRAMQ
jgi:hypothetical protein